MESLVSVVDGILRVKIVCPDSKEFNEKLSAVKSIYGRKWDGTLKQWNVPYSIDALDILKGAGFTLVPALEEKLKEAQIINDTKLEDATGYDFEELKNLFPHLRDYQIEAIRWFDARKGRGVLGDPMGLGKTCESLHWLKLHSDLSPVLIVCPAQLKYNWQNEIKKWFGEDEVVTILFGQTPDRSCIRNRWTIINYDILFHWKEVLSQIPFSVILADECQYVSNDTAKRTRSFLQLAKNIPYRIPMSGTPIRNRPDEFFNVLNLIAPRDFPSRFNYRQRYCDPKAFFDRRTGRSIWTYNGATNIEELAKKVRPYILRREKRDVLKELPDKQKIIIPLESTSKSLLKEYENGESALLELYSSNLNFKGMALKLQDAIQTLMKLAYEMKRKEVFEWIDNFLETGEKLVVFGCHRNVIEELYKKYEKQAVRVYGGISLQEREESVRCFNEEENTRLFIGQIQAAGVGINLHHACSTVAFVEFTWSPEDHEQAEDRVHRLGQREAVMIYYLVANGTIDMKITDILINKNKVVRQIVDGRDGDEFFGDKMEKLLVEGYKNSILA